MSLRTLFTITAVVAGLFGLAWIVAPQTVTLIYHDVPLEPGEVLLARLLGAGLVGFAVLTGLARNAGPSEARRAIVIMALVYSVLSFVLSFVAQLSGVEKSIGWSTVVVYFLFTVGYGYMQFVKKDDSAPPA